MASFEKLAEPSKKAQLKRYEEYEKAPRTDESIQRDYDNARKRYDKRKKDPRYPAWVEKHKND